MQSLPGLAIGVVLIVFGLVGLVAARDIVEQQGEVGVRFHGETPVEEATEIRITRLFGAIFLVLGIAAAAYGIGLF